MLFIAVIARRHDEAISTFCFPFSLTLIIVDILSFYLLTFLLDQKSYKKIKAGRSLPASPHFSKNIKQEN